MPFITGTDCIGQLYDRFDTSETKRAALNLYRRGPGEMIFQITAEFLRRDDFGETFAKSLVKERREGGYVRLLFRLKLRANLSNVSQRYDAMDAEGRGEEGLSAREEFVSDCAASKIGKREKEKIIYPEIR